MDSRTTKDQFRDLLDVHGAALPLDVACYLICQLGGYEVDIAAAQAELDRASERLPPTFEGVIATLFNDESGLRGNTSDYYNLRNSMLCEVQRSRQGIPITLSVLALEHARRANVTMVGIGLPGHFIVGAGTNGDLYADPFHGGAVLDRDGVRQLFSSAGGQGWRDEYLAPATNVDIVFRILNNIKVACSRSLADRAHLPWVLELLSWFPNGQPFDAAVADRSVAPLN